MALDDPLIPRVGKGGYRELAPLTPGMRTKLARPGVLDVEYPQNPVASRPERAERSNQPSGPGA